MEDPEPERASGLICCGNGYGLYPAIFLPRSLKSKSYPYYPYHPDYLEYT